MALLLAHCDNPTPVAMVGQGPDGAGATVTSTVILRPLAQTPADASQSVDASIRQQNNGRSAVPMHIDRVAALDESTILAVSDQKLYRVRAGRWEQLTLDGGVAQSVLAANHALWVLAVGTGDNRDRALVLRSSDADSLVTALVVRSPMEAGSWRIRSFATNRLANTWWIAGASPTLLRVDPLAAARVEAAFDIPELVSIYLTSDESLVGLRSDGDFEVFRYGVRTSVVGDGHLISLADEFGTTYVVHDDGSVWRGRPAREIRRIATRAPFEPRAATILPDGKPVLVGAGGPLATWGGGQWQVIPGEWPSDPVAITSTTPPMVIGRDGTVVVAEGNARVLVRSTSENTAENSR